jgi:putative membrane protein insertion efficiency factor
MVVSIFKSLLRFYHWVVSPWLGNRCRFVPTCSEYAQQALDRHGAMRGLYLTMRRLMRCHPWGGAGLDPVPECSHGIDAKNLSDDH